jgi:hypothetical protein
MLALLPIHAPDPIVQSLRMLIDVLLRAAHILQSQPGYTMPLFRLHAQLTRELGPAAGTYGQIYQQLRKRTDSFALVDSPRLLDGANHWPGLVQETYDTVLEGAGLGSCVRVTLMETDANETCDLVAALSVTLGELAAQCSDDHALTAYLAAATQQVAELNRVIVSAGTGPPTTPLPGPPPSA